MPSTQNGWKHYMYGSHAVVSTLNRRNLRRLIFAQIADNGNLLILILSLGTYTCMSRSFAWPNQQERLRTSGLKGRFKQYLFAHSANLQSFSFVRPLLLIQLSLFCHLEWGLVVYNVVTLKHKLKLKHAHTHEGFRGGAQKAKREVCTIATAWMTQKLQCNVLYYQQVEKDK